MLWQNCMLILGPDHTAMTITMCIRSGAIHMQVVCRSEA